MSLTTGRVPALLSLPSDVLHHLLSGLSPSSLSSFAQTCHFANDSASDPQIWQVLSQRHFDYVPEVCGPTSVSDLARSFVFRWWLASGIFVPGVPVHFRKGFNEVRCQGGIDVQLDERESCYVWGGRFEQACVPTSHPQLALSFGIGTGNGIPVDGVYVRILHAAEKGGRVTVRFNDRVLTQSCQPPEERFGLLEIKVEAQEIRMKPRMNTLSVEYERESGGAYWLREVEIVPVVLGKKEVPKEKLEFVVRAVPERQGGYGVEEIGGMREEEEEEEEERTEERGARRERIGERGRRMSTPPTSPLPASPPASPRASPSASPPASPRRGSGKRKTQNFGKKNKFVYHHGHNRMPRGGVGARVRR